eukprot:COSAG04_NODE_866_length_9767_cov_2.846400_3_plen_172_part_00
MEGQKKLLRKAEYIYIRAPPFIPRCQAPAREPLGLRLEAASLASPSSLGQPEVVPQARGRSRAEKRARGADPYSVRGFGVQKSAISLGNSRLSSRKIRETECGPAAGGPLFNWRRCVVGGRRRRLDMVTTQSHEPAIAIVACSSPSHRGKIRCFVGAQNKTAQLYSLKLRG